MLKSKFTFNQLAETPPDLEQSLLSDSSGSLNVESGPRNVSDKQTEQFKHIRQCQTTQKKGDMVKSDESTPNFKIEAKFKMNAMTSVSLV